MDRLVVPIADWGYLLEAAEMAEAIAVVEPGRQRGVGTAVGTTAAAGMACRWEGDREVGAMVADPGHQGEGDRVDVTIVVVADPGH
jgi:hypothetical protein